MHSARCVRRASAKTSACAGLGTPDELRQTYLTTRSVQVAREAGALVALQVALTHLAHLRCVEGNLDEAGALLDQADDLAPLTGTEPFHIGRLWLTGYRGDETEAMVLIEAAEPLAIARGGEGIVLTFAEHARAV